MLNHLWLFLIGPPLPTQRWETIRLNKFRALAAFSPDALSSIAYANQEIYLALAVAGSAGLAWTFPIGLLIAALLTVVAISYFQTIHAYPNGGGSYIVARENLGLWAGLVAAAALMISYVLTAAVSLTAGVEALASAFPGLWAHRVTAAMFLLVIITVINLRGVQEAGAAMALPVYFFLVAYLGMLAFGLWRALSEGPALPAGALPAGAPLAGAGPAGPLSLLIILHAFASGCTALTGIEAISNGVPVFRPPEARNAGRTLVVMAILMGCLFLGSTALTQYFGVLPGPEETILSALAHRLVGNGLLYYLVQISTLSVLVVAANTSFAGFPRLVSILARDGFLPRQLSNLGDRLNYMNGMLLLAFAVAILVLVSGGASHALVPLFAVGAFLAFTLSQAGMVRHWFRLRGRGWPVKSLLNGLGALVTGVTVLIVAYSKFLHGAWLTLALIPLLVWMFSTIRRHFRALESELSLHGLPPSLRARPKMRLVVPISGVHRGTVEAITYAQTISDRITAVYIELEPGRAQKVRADWQVWFPDIPLVVEPSPYRAIIRPLLDFLDRTDQEHHDGQLAAVLLPEIVPRYTWQTLLHNQGAWLIKLALLYGRRRLGYQRLIIDVPFHLKA